MMPLFRRPKKAPPVDPFVRMIKNSGLVADDVLQAAHAEFRESHPTSIAHERERNEQFADHLISRNILTPWQAEKLLDGRWKGFFIGPFKLLAHFETTDVLSIYVAEEIYLRRRVHMHVMPTSRIPQDYPGMQLIDGVYVHITEIE